MRFPKCLYHVPRIVRNPKKFTSSLLHAQRALTDPQKISNDMKEGALFLPLEAEREIEKIAEASGVLAGYWTFGREICFAWLREAS